MDRTIAGLPLAASVLLLASLASCTWARAPADALYACGPQDACPDGHVCEGGVCVPSSAECEPTTCAAQGKNCGAILDGCGGLLDCGTCAAPESCGGGGNPNVCGAGQCTPESPSQFCARFNRGCGDLTAEDNCGVLRTESCGTCQAPATCGGGGVPFHCGICKPLTDEELCVREGATCQVIDVADNCGVMRSVTCGCSLGICQADGGCCVRMSDDALCAMYGRTCGTFIVTECGLERTIESCGSCGDTSLCDDAGSCEACVSEQPAATCQRYGRACGTLEARDNCGELKTIDCGTCQPGDCGPTGMNCTCSPPLATCIDNAGCCNGTCGPAALCCALAGEACNDDSECCDGVCAQGQCVPITTSAAPDGGTPGPGASDAGP